MLIATTMLSRVSAFDVRLGLEFMIRKVPGVRKAVAAGNINSVWPPLVLGTMTVCDTYTNTHTYTAIWLFNVTGGFSDDLFL